MRPRASSGVAPSTVARPACGRSRPARIRSSVVFPAPFAPKTATVAPAGSANDTSRSATRSPYARPTPSSATTGALVAVAAVAMAGVPAQRLDRVLEHRRDHGEQLLDRLGAAGEVD